MLVTTINFFVIPAVKAEENLHFLILLPESKRVTYEFDASDFNDLVDLHNEQGVDTRIKQISLDPGEDYTPEAVRDFIAHEENDWDVDYLLIAGDTHLIPVKIISVEVWNAIQNKYYTYHTPTDLYYGCLDEDFTDLNETFDAEMCVGRACVSNINEVNNFVQKTKQYINNCKNGKMYLGNILGVAIQNFGGSIDSLIEDVPINVDDDENPGGYHLTKIYEKYPPDNENFYDWGPEDVKKEINNSINLLIHIGHGSRKSTMKGWNYDDGNDLNNIETPFFLYSYACNIGDFKEDEGEDCWAERIGFHYLTGTFASIVNSQEGIFDGVNPVAKSFFGEVFNHGNSIGKALSNARCKGYDQTYADDQIRLARFEVNLLGDPLVHIMHPPYEQDEDHPNSPPDLTLVDDYGVDPKVGVYDEADGFTFRVHYDDYDGDFLPGKAQIIFEDRNNDYDMDDDEPDSEDIFSKVLQGKKIGLGKNCFHFHFTDGEGGITKLYTNKKQNPLNVTVRPSTPIIDYNGNKLKRLKWYTFDIEIQEDKTQKYNPFENLEVNIKIDENSNGRIWCISFNDGWPENWIFGQDSDWVPCQSNKFSILCRWPLANWPGPHLCNISVQTRYKQDDEEEVWSDVKTIQVNIGNFWNALLIDDLLHITTNGSYTAKQNETINMDSTITGGTPPYHITWDYGDGTTANGQTTSHTYQKAGEYLVICTVSDNTGTRNENYTTTTIKGVTLETPTDVIIKNETVPINASLYAIQPNTNHWYCFNTGENMNDSNTDGNVTLYTNFTESGTYKINVTVHNGSINGPIIGYDEKTIQVVPFKIDTGGPYAGFTTEPIQFKGDIYYDVQCISAEWEFGDGETGTGLTTNHVYDPSGNKTYTANLTVTIPGFDPVTQSTTVTIWNISQYIHPEAVLDGPYCGKPEDTIQISGADSSGQNLDYFWSIDNEPWELRSHTITETFSHITTGFPSLISVKLKVVDENNFSDITSSTITISEVTADFHWEPTLPMDVEPINFIDDSAPEGCENPDYWLWDFGDGNTSSDQNPTHTYADDGYYYVTLITGVNGEYQSTTKRIYINNKPPTAEFTMHPRVAAKYDTITFNSTSVDADGRIAYAEWDIGDDTFLQTENGTNNYSTSGFFTIRLDILDDDYDQDHIIQQDHLLVADALVSNEFTEDTPGWNTTRFNSIQSGVHLVPENGVLVVCNGTYEPDEEIMINRSMNIYAVSEGYDTDDEQITYGDVIITGNGFVVDDADVLLKGFTLQQSSTGLFHSSGVLCVEDCLITSCSIGINATNESLITIDGCDIIENDIGIKLSGVPNGSIKEGQFQGNTESLQLSECAGIEIIDCDFTPEHQGITLTNSDMLFIGDCDITGDYLQGILLENSKNTTISDCTFSQGKVGVRIENGTGVNTTDSLMQRIVNHIENCRFSENTYGVILDNADGTRIGGSTWYIQELNGLYPTYPAVSEMGTQMSWFTPLHFPEGCMFFNIDFPVSLMNADYNVIDGIQVSHMIIQYVLTSVCT